MLEHDTWGIDIENYFLTDIENDMTIEIYYNPDLIQLNKALSEVNIPARFGPAVKEDGTLKTRMTRENDQKVLLITPAIYTLRGSGKDTSDTVCLRDTLTRFEKLLQEL